MFNAKQFLVDWGIDHSEEGADWTPGWVMVRCPYCDDTKYHGGFELAGNRYRCWRCGNHPMQKTIMLVAGVSYREATGILKQYDHIYVPPNKRKARTPTSINWPEGSAPLKKTHEKYLRKRRFDPQKIIDTWGVQGTGFTGPYKFRIIAPVIVNGIMVSYQGRDITGHADLNYKACKKSEEIIHHKHVLYGIDYIGDTAVIVEGLFDCWRMGPGAVCTFGSSWTMPQAIMLSEKVNNAFLLYDGEPEAQKKAESLGVALSGLGVSVENLDLGQGDPDDLPQSGADEIMSGLNL